MWEEIQAAAERRVRSGVNRCNSRVALAISSSLLHLFHSQMMSKCSCRNPCAGSLQVCCVVCLSNYCLITRIKQNTSLCTCTQKIHVNALLIQGVNWLPAVSLTIPYTSFSHLVLNIFLMNSSIRIMYQFCSLKQMITYLCLLMELLCCTPELWADCSGGVNQQCSVVISGRKLI